MYQQERLDGGFLDFVNKQLANVGSLVKDTLKDAASKTIAANQNAANAQAEAYNQVAISQKQKRQMMIYGGIGAAVLGTVVIVSVMKK